MFHGKIFVSIYFRKGGPLISIDKSLVGIVSWVIPCGMGFPDVYTDVFPHLDWINTMTTNE